MGPTGCRRRRTRLRASLLALVLASAPSRILAQRGFVAVPLDQVAARLDPSARGTFTPQGLRFDVAGPSQAVLPFAAEQLELELEANGPILLIWSVQVGSTPLPWGRPWRYQAAPDRPTTVKVDLKTVAGWTNAARPVLAFDGAGQVLVRAMRVLPPRADAEQARRDYDRARFWAPESVGPVLINAITPVFWSESRRTWFADVVALAALASFGLALGILRVRRGRSRPALALGAATLVALGLWNGHFLVRFLPMANLRPTPDPEARIRANYYYLPEFGALAALARATIGPDERVAAAGKAKSWFAPQTLCFDLAPRRCVILRPNEEVHAGISGVDRLRTSELDVIVSYRGPELPPGFVPVAAVSPSSYIARRR